MFFSAQSLINAHIYTTRYCHCRCKNQATPPQSISKTQPITKTQFVIVVSVYISVTLPLQTQRISFVLSLFWHCYLTSVCFRQAPVFMLMTSQCWLIAEECDDRFELRLTVRSLLIYSTTRAMFRAVDKIEAYRIGGARGMCGSAEKFIQFLVWKKKLPRPTRRSILRDGY